MAPPALASAPSRVYPEPWYQRPLNILHPVRRRVTTTITSVLTTYPYWFFKPNSKVEPGMEVVFLVRPKALPIPDYHLWGKHLGLFTLGITNLGRANCGSSPDSLSSQDILPRLRAEDASPICALSTG